MNYLKPLPISSKLSHLLLPACLLLLTACNPSSSTQSNVSDTVSVDLGSDLTVRAGENVQLTASIRNQDSSVLTYQWLQISGNNISLKNTKSLEFTTTVNDLLEFEVTVADNQGMEYTDSIIVTVLPADENTQNSALLSWTAPTINEDGSSLTNLAGYKLYRGESAQNLDTFKSVNAQQTSYEINNLVSGYSYFFCVKAYNNKGTESQCSTTVKILL